VTASRRAVTWLSLLVIIDLAWGAAYIHRTSFVHDGQRVFSLWDDAMISMQYARNLRLGHGLVWNAGGERVQGFTNLGVTLVMAGAHWLPLARAKMALPLQVLELAMLLAILLLSWGLARRLFPDSEWIALGGVLAVALCAPLATWSLQGSDVGFVALWLTAVAFALSEPAVGPRLRLLTMAAGLWIRPDMVLFYVPALLAARAAGGGRRIVLWGVGVLAATLAAQLAFGQLYYGDPLPNTYYLKATGSPRALMWASGWNELWAWLPQLAVPTVLALLVAVRQRANPVVMLIGSWVVLAQAYNIWVGGDFIVGYGSRFVASSLPFLLVLAVAGWWQMLTRLLPAGRVFGPVLFWLGTLAMAVGISPDVSRSEWLTSSAVPMHRDNNRNNYNFAIYLRRHTTPDTTLAAHWGGVPVYFSGRPAIDVLGRSDRHIAKLDVEVFYPGHSKWDWDYVLERAPDVFRAPSRNLGARPDFRQSYVKVETRFGVNFFMRSEALGKLADEEVILVDLISGEKSRRGDTRGR
jgi:hypothetical protein